MLQMRMHDGLIKNTLREGVKLLHKRKHKKYEQIIRERSRDLPDFSLLASDCIAGLIYHTMGRKFLSPTINMSIKDSDFLKLLSDMPYYFSQDIQFAAAEHYPKGYIGEGEKTIRIDFEHYRTDEEAREKWNERKRRIIGNVYIIMADQNLSDEEIDQFRHLEEKLPNIKRKIMFTWKKEREDKHEIFYVKTYGRPRIKNWSKIRADGFRDYEVFFDYVAWLKMEKDFMRDQTDGGQ